MYEIQSKSDFKVGATLIVKIPNEELDEKALYTILANKPDFILPFSYRDIDGEIEFTYQIGSCSKLSYLSGERSPSEYSNLWSRILQPLLDCGDWFMKPYSFVFNTEYLYYDKDSKKVSFVYIPSLGLSSDYNALKDMVTEIVKLNHVTDINLQNKVLWAIQNFEPNEFLQLVKPYMKKSIKENIFQQLEEPMQQPMQQNVQPQLKQPDLKSSSEEGIYVNKVDDISINLSKNVKTKKKKTEVSHSKKEVKSKSKFCLNLWGKKKEKEEEIIQGSAIIANKAKPDHNFSIAPVYTPPTDEGIDYEVTQLEINESCCSKFRYVGNGGHPKIIDVEISEEDIFTIGRYDSSTEIKQSSFEFDKKTRAVSRHHAVVERNVDGYNIIDLASSAGTFLNGQKLPPNAPFKLEGGSHISFGNAGADYIWEE